MKFYIFEVIAHSFGIIKNHAKFFITLISLFVALNFAMILLVQKMQISSFWLIILIRLVMLALYVKLAVTVHRSVLLGEVGKWRPVFSWRAYDSMFFVVSLAVYFATAVSVAVLYFMFSFVFSDAVDYLSAAENKYHAFLIFSLIGGAIFSKICLIYPSTAIDKELGIEESVDITDGHFIQIFILLCVMPLFFSLAGEFINLDDNSMWVMFFIALVVNVLVVFQITVLSHIYQRIVPSQTSDKNTETEDSPT